MDTIAHSLKPDARLNGRYRIETVLGEGGFGITYKACDERLERYLDEAKALARFNPPHIIRILDYFQANGTAYIVMNYEQGQTLEERLRDSARPLDQPQILQILLPLLQGLDKVHAAGLLHRDIKPGNLPAP